MPKTVAYLKYKGAIELLGYNKVDDNTFPNLTPMLLGIKETDLKRTCWPDTNANFDNCPFIWQWFKEAGFQTALGEDTAKLDIDDQWCTCHKNIKISTSSFDAQEVAEELVEHLNGYLEEHKECAKLALSEVLHVTEMMVGTPRKDEVGWREFMAVVRTTPGDGVFEGTLRKHKDKWSLAGAISRLNLYGNQSHCVHHYQLKLYCYCQ
ncbi:unnamed protein product [Spodoptera exigua]|nr:unnamed protein product [Spodoptera exigua]